MNHLQFVQFIDAELQRIGDLVADKDADYAGRDAESAFSNFHHAAEVLQIPEEKVWYVWMWKHWSAVETYVRDGGISSEPIDGRLDDVIGYCLLLKGLIREKENILPTTDTARTTEEMRAAYDREHPVATLGSSARRPIADSPQA